MFFAITFVILIVIAFYMLFIRVLKAGFVCGGKVNRRVFPSEQELAREQEIRRLVEAEMRKK